MQKSQRIYRSILLVSIIGSLIFATSCGDFDEEDLGPDSEITFGIRHDKPLTDYETVATNTAPYNTGDFPDFESVVNFTYSLNGSSEPEFVATGLLVAPDWILTAGHNFFDSEDQNQPAVVTGINVNLGNDPNNPSSTLDVEALVFHPTWINESEVIVGANDFCLVKLKSPVTSINPAILDNSGGEAIGGTVWYAGYGDYSGLPGQNSELYSKKHAISNILDRAVDGITSRTANNVTWEGGLVAFDFDSPDGLVNSLGDDYTSEDEPLLGGGTSSADALDFEGGTVEGDSGGPLFQKIGSEWRVIGILSGGANEPVPGHRDGNYGDISIFTRVSTSIDWINSVIE